MLRVALDLVSVDLATPLNFAKGNNSMPAGVRFIRKGGKIIPIRTMRGTSAGHSVAQTAIASVGSALIRKPKKIEPNQALSIAGTGMAIASGILSGVTFGKGKKGFLLGTGGSIGLDVASSAANVAAFAGKGHTRMRIKAGAKQELTNMLVGNAAFGAAILATPSSRKALVEMGSKAITYGRKLLKFL
jgi:hypothetical protein